MNEDQFPGEELLSSAGKGDADALAQLDSMGFLMKPRENAESYVGRIRAMHARFLEFLEKTSDGKSYEIYDGIVLSQKERIPDEIIEEAARTFGAGPVLTLRKIVLPLISANLIVGALFAFSFSMLEVSDSLILAQKAEHFPITRAIFDLSQILGSGPFTACAFGVWTMVFLAATLAAAGVILGKKIGTIFRF